LKLLLAGYIGCGNVGDDAIALGFASSYREPNTDVTVLSGEPQRTFGEYGLMSIPRKDMKAVEKAIKECDALVFPGGSIFQDVTSVRSVAYYSQLVSKAKKADKKVLLLGQGVGPLKNFLARKMALNAFNAADAVAVRDPGSLETLRQLGCKRPIKVTADAAFLLPEPPQFTSDNFEVAGMQTVGLSPRPWGKGQDIINLFGELSRLLYDAKVVPVLIGMDRYEDDPLILEIGKKMGGRIPDLRKVASPSLVQQRMARMSAVVAMRLHAGILASTVGIMPLMLDYDPKVAAFSKQLGIGPAMSLQGITPQRIFEQINGMLKNKEKLTATMALKRQEMTKLAMLNVELARETLKRGV
jgi:polysaccharide pyruvyl transferase CsaB